jgi:hypothetical protein
LLSLQNIATLANSATAANLNFIETRLLEFQLTKRLFHQTPPTLMMFSAASPSGVLSRTDSQDFAQQISCGGLVFCARRLGFWLRLICLTRPLGRIEFQMSRQYGAVNWSA